MSPQSLQAVALTFAYFVGGFLAWLAYDGILFAIRGHTATISHGYAWIGDAHPWFRGVWLVALIGLAVFLYWHFWGWVRPW